VGKTDGRVIGVPGAGGCLPLGQNDLWLMPAHFMHSEGNFQFWDPVSRILFIGDLGVSLLSGADAQKTGHRTCGPHRQDGGLRPPLHGVQQDLAPVGAHGASAADRSGRRTWPSQQPAAKRRVPLSNSSAGQAR